MKSKLIVLTLALSLSLFYSKYVSANEGMMNKSADTKTEMRIATEEDVKTLPNVGNKICPVSGNPIPAQGEKGEMGDEAIKYEYNGKIYNLCCEMCVKDFKKNPEKYSKIAEDEAKKNKEEGPKEKDQSK